MISKENFIKNFSEDNINEALKIYENYKLAYEKDIPIFSNGFYSPNIWIFFENNCRNNNFSIISNGIFKDAERRMIAFNNKYDTKYPIEVLEIKNKSNFSILEHKDYLGAILSLGIERSKIGDIVVKNDRAYAPITEEICSYIMNNLSYIGRSPIEIKILNDYKDLPTINFEEFVINVPSLRLDSIVAKITNTSRAKAIELLDNNKVFVNYIKLNNKSKELLTGNRLTIRGYGKYIVGDIVGETKSGKQKIIMKKYI